MANSWFRFKQFTVDHSNCAMKVGTDGVLLGAWAGQNLTRQPTKILDIGTGTGLVALMYAQRFPDAEVIAVEKTSDCFLQCQQNFDNSPWKNRLNAVHDDFLTFVNTPTTFDLIVSNPPYFENSPKPLHPLRAAARHREENLTLEKLIFYAKQLLHTEGVLSLILPFSQQSELERIVATYDLQIINRTMVKGHEAAPIKRILVDLTANQKLITKSESLLVLESNRNHRSSSYKKLTEAFYL